MAKYQRDIRLLFGHHLNGTNVILVLSYMATLFPASKLYYSFSKAFACYYIDPQTNTITPFSGRNIQHITGRS